MKAIATLSAILFASCASAPTPSSQRNVDVIAEPPQQQADADLFQSVLLEHLPAGAMNVSVILTPDSIVYARYELFEGSPREISSAYGRRMDATRSRKDDFTEMSRYIAWDIERVKDLRKKAEPPPANDRNSANIVVTAVPPVSQAEADVLRRVALDALSDAGPLTIVFSLRLGQPQRVRQGSSFTPPSMPSGQFMTGDGELHLPGGMATGTVAETGPSAMRQDEIGVWYIVYGASGKIIDRGPAAAPLYADANHEDIYQAVVKKIAKRVAK